MKKKTPKANISETVNLWSSEALGKHSILIRVKKHFKDGAKIYQEKKATHLGAYRSLLPTWPEVNVKSEYVCDVAGNS